MANLDPPRELTDREKDTLREILELMRTGDQDLFEDDEFPTEPVDPDPYLAQIDNLRVVEECGCGCDSIYFKHIGPKEEIKPGAQGAPIVSYMKSAKDYTGIQDDDLRENPNVLMFLFAHEGELCELEVV